MKRSTQQCNPHLHINAQAIGYGSSIFFEERNAENDSRVLCLFCSLDLDLLKVHVNWTF